MAKYLVREYYPTSLVIGCEFRDNPKEAQEAEWKIESLGSNVKFICPGKASSTTDEEGILFAATDKDINNSIVLSNGAHIRRARLVWNYYHPNSHLRFVSTDMRLDDDPDNPILAQRYWQVWMVANLVGLIGYKLRGVDHFERKNFSQPFE